jgi:type I restriction enzyme R subunit
LSAAERVELKKVAHQLLLRLKSLLVLNWREKSQARAQVHLAIEDELDRGLPQAYTRDIYGRKCSQVFEHVYENYFGEGASIFSTAA